MKTSLVRTFFVASPVSLTFLLALLGGAQATEDPAEVEERRQAAARASPSPLDKFRTDYRALYKIKLSNPVGEDLPLGMYPREVSHKVAKLSFFGTPSWESRWNVDNILQGLNLDYAQLLAGPFHPERVESQLQETRTKHLEQSSKLVQLMFEKWDDLEGVLGEEEVDKHLRFYQMVRNLAAHAELVPTM
ncbi:hypothetical protein EX895_001089 [Sporisorium graminicola]|uniref:Uncharacterized protein n=1 Tax=Sporisorium graminicola TaxID=280036 RepID=A0A4U7L364_9BASI|nr:hypothetical protein EX895_001089 [Sporisorium graminicola]TKY89792.1 hypothetical protein EX895_001089 [Sporisorium graminicola]